MAKTGKYFRLSKQAVQILEQRDREKYPYEVDLIEAGIVSGDGKKQKVEELLCEIRQELRELRRLVVDKRTEEDYPLPRL